MLASVRPVDGVVTERKRQAQELLKDVRRLDVAIKDTRARITLAVKASKTTLTDIYGVGPVVAALVIGHAGPVGRFTTRHQFASYNGTAPIEASSGPKKRHRLNPRGNRQLNHALHIVAICQIRYDTPGRAYYLRKLEEGKTRRKPSALSSAGSPTSSTASCASTPPAPGAERAREDNQGRLFSGVTGLHPDHRRFGQVTPGPSTTLRNRPAPRFGAPGMALLTQRGFVFSRRWRRCEMP